MNFQDCNEVVKMKIQLVTLLLWMETSLGLEHF